VTYAAEPYAQFVDDLLTALTGGAIREQFRFLPEEVPYRLAAPGPVIGATLRVNGLVDGVYHRFVPRTDFTLASGNVLQWTTAATLPDLGSTFFASYEMADSQPQLTDRNPGSVTRLLAESFAREYAVLSRQLEAVYQAGFVETASGRDLEQLAALLGVERRQRLFASGSVLFSRNSPAPADIFVPAGTRISSAEPPGTVFETTEERTLQRGTLSVEAPIQATVGGPAGVVPAQAVRLIHRPILGIDTVANPQPTRFSGSDESDAQLRARLGRTLEAAGRASTGALLGALTTLPGVREKDIRIAEDYLAHPGVVKLNLALPEMSADELLGAQLQAIDLIEATRPVGVRIEHNIDAPLAAGAATVGEGAVADDPDEPDAPPVDLASSLDPAAMFVPISVEAKLTPTTLALSAAQREQLLAQAEATIRAFFQEAGLGETLVYNRLVAQLMMLDGVLDVALQMNAPSPGPDQPAPSGRRNLILTNPDTKPVLALLEVELGGALVMLDISVAITLKGAALIVPDPASAKATVLQEVADKLKTFVATLESGTLDVDRLKHEVPDTDTYTIDTLHYQVDFVEAGVRIHQQDVSVPLTGLERLWIRQVESLGGSAS
jgi:phage-related baseplate assembly protein